MAMIRHCAAVQSPVPVCLLSSSRTYEEIIFREELGRLAHDRDEHPLVLGVMSLVRQAGLRHTV